MLTAQALSKAHTAAEFLQECLVGATEQPHQPLPYGAHPRSMYKLGDWYILRWSACKVTSVAHAQVSDSLDEFDLWP